MRQTTFSQQCQLWVHCNVIIFLEQKAVGEKNVLTHPNHSHSTSCFETYIVPSGLLLLSHWVMWFFVTPWTAAHQASLSLTISQSLPKFMSIEQHRTANPLEKTLMRGKIEGKRRREKQRMRWLERITDSMDMNLGYQDKSRYFFSKKQMLCENVFIHKWCPRDLSISSIIRTFMPMVTAWIFILMYFS